MRRAKWYLTGLMAVVIGSGLDLVMHNPSIVNKLNLPIETTRTKIEISGLLKEDGIVVGKGYKEGCFFDFFGSSGYYTLLKCQHGILTSYNIRLHTDVKEGDIVDITYRLHHKVNYKGYKGVDREIERQLIAGNWSYPHDFEAKSKKTKPASD